MAKILDFEVKGVKYYPDHGGDKVPYRSLYYKGKRLGAFRMDAWGGPMAYDHFSKNISKEDLFNELLKIPKHLGWHEFYESYDIIIENLVELKEWEGHCKKLRKKGKILVLLKENYARDPLKHLESRIPSIGFEVDENITEDELEQFTRQLKEKYGDGEIRIFRNLEDFNL